MVAPTSQASPLSMRADASARLTFPTRTDLISVPVRTMPASNESSIEYSWRALRFWATVFSSPMASSWVRCGLAVTRLADRRQDGGSNNPTAGIYGRWAPVRTEAGLGRNRGSDGIGARTESGAGHRLGCPAWAARLEHAPRRTN